MTRATRVVLHFVRTRGVEVGALQASPLLGAYLGGIHDLGRLALLLAGSLALTAHVFVFNDWADYDRHAHVDRRDIVVLSGELLTVAFVIHALVGWLVLVIGAAISVLGVLYSSSAHFG